VKKSKLDSPPIREKIVQRLAVGESQVVIPMNLATQSEGIWPGVPIERGHLFRSMWATPSERSDAGVF
jgi:hypothetical protein